MLRDVVKRNRGPLGNEPLVRVFREIMSACLAQEEPLKVAFLGPEGTFTQSAVLKHFGHSVRALSLPTIAEVFHEVEGGVGRLRVVPVENSIEGTVTNTLDVFLSSPLKICGEVELRIRQHLMGRMKNIRDIKRICSHPQSLAQCRAWLAQSIPEVETTPVSSNAAAARRARDEVGTAAIAGDVAAEMYELNILFANIEDYSDNTTRFLVIGRKLFPSSGDDKTSLLVSSGGTKGPGVLHQLLDPLARNGISMTRIESRPSRRRKWDYVFFVDNRRTRGGRRRSPSPGAGRGPCEPVPRSRRLPQGCSIAAVAKVPLHSDRRPIPADYVARRSNRPDYFLSSRLVSRAPRRSRCPRGTGH